MKKLIFALMFLSNIAYADFKSACQQFYMPEYIDYHARTMCACISIELYHIGITRPKQDAMSYQFDNSISNILDITMNYCENNLSGYEMGHHST